MVKYTTAGESHGRSLISVVEGIPAGVRISTEEIRSELARRRGGIGRGERQKFEQDDVTILSGVIQGQTIASPIAIEIKNSEWSKWDKIMSPDDLGGESTVTESGMQAQPNMPVGQEADRLVTPRPGHADLPGMIKYGFTNARPVLERASARETASRVAAGAIAKAFIKQAYGITVTAEVVQFGSVKRADFADGDAGDTDFEKATADFATSAVSQGQTVGGIVRVVANNVPVGLGSYISADQRLDSAIAGALMSIQAVKGVEIGDGFDIAGVPGKEAHDLIYAGSTTSAPSSEHSASESADFGAHITRQTNHAGGIEGGISNGEPIIAQIAIKPIPSVPAGLPTVNVQTGEPATSHAQRSDASAVYPARIVAEAELALVLANFITRRDGQDVLLPHECTNTQWRKYQYTNNTR